MIVHSLGIPKLKFFDCWEDRGDFLGAVRGQVSISTLKSNRVRHPESISLSEASVEGSGMNMPVSAIATQMSTLHPCLELFHLSSESE